MELVIKKLNPAALIIGGVYRVVGTYNGFKINCLAACINVSDDVGEYVTIKDYGTFTFKCCGDIFKLNINNYTNFTTFTRVKTNELRVFYEGGEKE